MQDPSVVDASHPITATLSCLAPEAAKSVISWLHDGHPPPNSNGSEYLIFSITLWHACSLLQPDFSFFSFFFDSGFRRVNGLRAPVFTTATPTLPLERLRVAAAWLSHPTHVPVLTSPRPGGDQLEVWLCDSDSILFLSDAALTSRVTVARSYYVGYGVQNTVAGGGGGGGSSERILALRCQLLDTCYYGSSDVRLSLARGCWRVGYDIDNGSTIVTIRMPAALAHCVGPMTDSALLEGSWQGHALRGPSGMMASPDLDDPDTGTPSASESQGQARARDGRLSTSAVLEDSHEARGVGLIVKALVQQNASASLFLRTMVCVAVLLCSAHSILVLGERPSLFVGCRTS